MIVSFQRKKETGEIKYLRFVEVELVRKGHEPSITLD